MNSGSINDKVSELEFAGVGTVRDIQNLRVREQPRHSKAKELLGEWHSTAICGNDIGSSCLYVSALAIAAAGKLAPLALLGIGLVLYLFRKVYAEVLSALPLNGGAYNALLNTTTKAKASVAACLTLLSYLATAVISGSEAIHYSANLIPGMPIDLSVIGLLTVFAVLTIAGIGESAKVALGIFIVHIGSLVMLCLIAIASLVMNPEILLENMRAPLPQTWPYAIFFGFAAAFLGVSGFESSANFIEEQKPGVFPKTLRNMWFIVIIFNPLIAFLALAVIPFAEFGAHREDLLAHMGGLVGGDWLRIWVSINAALVLSGAVLTAFVGSNGLVRRMTLDGCLPQFLLVRTPWRTDIVAILTFWLLCCSIFVVTHGKLQALANVYTISFLSVMALFALGNMLLKLRRSRLPRETEASWYEVGIAFLAVILGLVGNLVMAGKNVFIFFNYFFAVFVVVGVMLFRTQLLRITLNILSDVFEHSPLEDSKVSRWIHRMLNIIRKRPVVYFSRGDDLANLNRALLYIRENEISHHIEIVHIYQDKNEISRTFKRNLMFLDQAYPEIKIDLLTVKGSFNPETIQALSRELDVPVNYMFISTPGDQFPHNVAELGGVRVIV